MSERKIALNSGQYHVHLWSQNLAKYPKVSRGFLHLSERSFIIMLRESQHLAKYPKVSREFLHLSERSFIIIMLLLGLVLSLTEVEIHTPCFTAYSTEILNSRSNIKTMQKSQNLQCHQLSAWLIILEEEDIRSNVKELKILKSAMPSFA